jgi:hypothetical protein
MNEYFEQPRGIVYRFIQSLTGVLILACLVAGYLGLHAIVWRHESELPTQLATGLTLAGIVGGVLALIYLIFGIHSLRFLLRFNWISIQLGMVVGILLYGGYNVITPLVFTYASEPAYIRALQGGVTGALIGAFIGLLIAFISPKPTLLTPSGVLRYGVLYLLVLIGLSVLVWVGTQPGVSRNLPFWLFIPLVIVLRVAVTLYDFYQLRRRAAAYHYDERDYSEAVE